MTFSAILFYILAAIVLYGAVRTVTAKNPVHAALHLVLTFCVSAMLWMLMQAEFLGVTLVVVYVGAVMVLFLFVVMMLNIDIEEMRAGFWRHAPVAGVVGTLLAVALILILVNPKTDLAAFGLMKDIPADTTISAIWAAVFIPNTCCRLNWRRYYCCWAWWPRLRWFTAKPPIRNVWILPTKLKYAPIKAVCVW